MTDALLDGLELKAASRRRVRAAIGHVVGFWTWRSLVVEQKVSTGDAASLAAEFVLAALEH